MSMNPIEAKAKPKRWVSVSEVLDHIYGKSKHRPGAARRGEEIHAQIHHKEVARAKR